MRLPNVILVAISWLVVAAPALHAQRAAKPLPRFVSTFGVEHSPTAPQGATVTFGHPHDYRWEGFLVGGAALGVLAIVWAQGHPLALAFGFVAGGVPGGLIGALIPKAPADSTQAVP